MDNITKVEKAIELIEEAKALIDEAVEETRIESNYRAYGRYGLDTALGNGNRHDSSVFDVLGALREENGQVDYSSPDWRMAIDTAREMLLENKGPIKKREVGLNEDGVFAYAEPLAEHLFLTR